jgi:hypothetical protein
MNDNIIKTIEWLEENLTEKPIYGGSFGLFVNGLLDREIHDLDIITTTDYYVEITKHLFKGDLITFDFRQEGQSNKFVRNDCLVKVFKVISPYGINIDFLFVSNNHDVSVDIKYKTIKFGNLELNIEDPNEAIVAKYSYQSRPELLEDHREKHRRDLENMNVTISQFEYQELKEIKRKYQEIVDLIERKTNIGNHGMTAHLLTGPEDLGTWDQKESEDDLPF